MPEASLRHPANLARWVRNQLVRFVGLPAGRIAQDYRRARRLAREQVVPLPHRPASDVSCGARRVVVSLTTIPERVGVLMPTLLSLVEQTVQPDRILLALPQRSLRSGGAYTLPRHLPDGIEIIRCTDTGPSTKLLPALLAEPDALIIAVDDDVIYARDFVETILNWHLRRPEAVLGWIGLNIEQGVNPKLFRQIWGTGQKSPVAVDILLGHGGLAIPPGAFDAGVHCYDGWPEELRWVDDVWFAGHLARRGVARLVVPAPGYSVVRPSSGHFGLTFGMNRDGRNDQVGIAAMAQWW